MKKFVFDTDMGIDDAVALLMILGYPEAEVEAVTSVVGNVPLAQATHNVGVVLDAVEARVHEQRGEPSAVPGKAGG